MNFGYRRRKQISHYYYFGSRLSAGRPTREPYASLRLKYRLAEEHWGVRRER